MYAHSLDKHNRDSSTCPHIGTPFAHMPAYRFTLADQCDLVHPTPPPPGHPTPPTPQIAMGVSDEKLQPAIPPSLPADLGAIATLCCDFDPAMRPCFADITTELEAVVARMQVGSMGVVGVGVGVEGCSTCGCGDRLVGEAGATCAGVFSG